jgi:hypothetical protein
MRRILLSAAIAASSLMLAASSQAASLGTATGDLVVHYSGTSETPANVTYVDSSNLVFNYNPGLVDSPNAPGYGSDNYFQNHADQFEFDIVMNVVPGSAGPVVALNHNTGTTSNVDWAITDPGWNSHLRGGDGDGSSILLTQNTVTPVGPIVAGHPAGFHWDLSGYLTSDGQVHWAGSPTTDLSIFDNANSPLNGFGVDDRIYFQGSFDYLTAADTTPGEDFYNGTIQFSTTPFAAVPVPAAAPVGAVLLAGLGLVRRFRRSIA